MTKTNWLYVLPLLCLLMNCSTGTTANSKNSITPQPAMSDFISEISESDQYQMNTYTWDYAPWMKSFQNHFWENWKAPNAYKSGIISGTVTLKFTVKPNGTVTDIKVTGNTGSIHFEQPSVDAVRSVSGLLPLPGHFSEKQLIITLSLHYPKWKQK